MAVGEYPLVLAYVNVDRGLNGLVSVDVIGMLVKIREEGVVRVGIKDCIAAMQ